MSKPVAGLLAILALLLAILIIFYLGRKTTADELTWRKAIVLFKKAKTPGEKWFVVFLYSPRFFKGMGYVSLIGTIATAGFMCIGTIFADPSTAEGWLGLAKKFVDWAYPYVERFWSGTPPTASPSPSRSPTP
jgi:hypothetical protein